MAKYPKTNRQKNADNKFRKVLQVKFDIWINKEGKIQFEDGTEMKRSQKSFAKLIHSSQSQISKWLNGDSQPSDEDFQAIIKVFNDDGIPTDEAEFQVSSRDDLYMYNEPYINNIINTIAHMYTEDSWTDFVKFLEFLKTIPGYDKDFPLFTEIEKDPDQEHTYRRQDLSSLISAAESTSCKYFQINKGDKGFRLLSTPDIQFLNEVRNAVINVIDELMKKRAADLKAAVNHVNFISVNEQRDLTDHELFLADAMNKGSSYLDEEGMNLINDYKYITENGELFIEENSDNKVGQEGSDKTEE